MNFLSSLIRPERCEYPDVALTDGSLESISDSDKVLKRIIHFASAGRSENVGITKRDMLVSKRWQDLTFVVLNQRALARGVDIREWSRAFNVQIHPVAMALLLTKINLAQMKECLGIDKAVRLMKDCFEDVRFLADHNKTRHILAYTEARNFFFPSRCFTFSECFMIGPIYYYGGGHRKIEQTLDKYMPDERDSTEQIQEKTEQLFVYMGKKSSFLPHCELSTGLIYGDIKSALRMPVETRQKLLLPPDFMWIWKYQSELFFGLSIVNGRRHVYPLPLDDGFFYMQNSYVKRLIVQGLDSMSLPKCFGYLPKLEKIVLRDLPDLTTIPEDFPIPSHFRSLTIEKCPLLRIGSMLQQRLHENNVAVSWADATDEQKLDRYRL